MNNQEAKFILSAYRPNGSDGHDPAFGDALRQAQTDPELGAWLGRARAHDAAVAGKLAEVPMPAGLRESILAGARASSTARSVWRHPAWMAAAAAVAVLVVSAAALWPSPALAKAPLVKFALQDAKEVSKHGGHGDPAHALQVALSDTSKRLGQSVPLDFAALQRTGCRTLEIDGRPVLEVCFNRKGTWLHCYVARLSDFPRFAARQALGFAVAESTSAAAWTDGVNLFVVAGSVGRETLAGLL